VERAFGRKVFSYFEGEKANLRNLSSKNLQFGANFIGFIHRASSKMVWRFKRQQHNDDNSQEQPPDIMIPDYVDNSHVDREEHETKTVASLWQRFRFELTHPSFFNIQDEVTGRTLDIPESFAPPTCRAFLFELAGLAVVVFTIVDSIVTNDDSSAGFYWAFLSSWGVSLCGLYSIASLVNTMLAARTPQSITWRIKITWILYVLALHVSSVATIMYWAVIHDYQEKLHFIDVFAHGILLLFVIVDGMVVNRIPLKLCFWWGWAIPLDLSFVAWTLIHDLVTKIGNPNESDNDPTTDDDALYDLLSWKNDWQTTFIWLVIIMFGVGPAVYMLLWSISSGGPCTDRRIYVDTVDENDHRPTVDDVEEGTIFARYE
jgi:hypothetical protein